MGSQTPGPVAVWDNVVITTEPPVNFEEKKKITIAVVQDGPSQAYDELYQKIEQELAQVIGEGKEVKFIRKGYNAQWNPKAIPGILGKALTDPQVDIILTMGLLMTQAAASPVLFLNKPVVATLVGRSEVFTLPISATGKSEKNNFTFVVLNLSVKHDFKVFQEMMHFKSVTLLVDRVQFGNFNGIRKILAQLEKDLGISIRVVQGGATAREFLNQLGPDTEAVMMTFFPRMSEAEFKSLVAGINLKKIPSYSFYGYPDVEQGVLVGLIPDTLLRTARRAALDIQEILLGFSAQDLSVMMPIQARILINAKTAKQIDYSPDFVTLQTANFTQAQFLAQGEKLNLDEALLMAGRQNIDFQISQSETQVSKQQSLIERSFLLPQGEGNVQYTQVDRDRALASLGALPQNSTTGNLTFSQVVFDDPLLSRFRTSRKEYRSSQFIQTATRYDAVLEGGRRYMTLLSTVALLKIEAENLNLTQENLEMARLRFEVGMAGLDEVYRWEAQEAQQRGLVFRRLADVENAMVALNQVLNVDQAKEWNPVDFNRKQAEAYFFGKKLNLNNLKEFNLVQEYLVGISFMNSPTLKSFSKQVEGQGIALNQKKRRFYTPSLGAQFLYSRFLQANRPGALVPSQTDANEWQFTGQVSLPLFQGGFRAHDMGQAKANLIRISGEQTRALQLIEQQTRTVINDLFSSGPNIHFSRRAADRAKLNLGIVKDKYIQGTVGIIDLIDAQNEYINREQEAALAVYQYVTDLIEVQRAISWYAVDHTEAELGEFAAEIRNYIETGGRLPGEPSESHPLSVEKNLENNSQGSPSPE